MRIVVCVKRAGLLGDEIELLDDGSAVDPDVLDFALNEWDAYAVEEALRLRDELSGDVVAVTVGDDQTDEVLRRALAMGVDRAVRAEADLAAFDPLGTARALHAAISPEAPDLVLCGVQSSDGGQGGTGAALAALLDAPCAAVVKAVRAGAGQVSVERELEGGVIAETDVRLPAVLTIQSGINEPRYASFRQIKQAEQHPIDVRNVSSPTAGLRLAGVREPERGAGAEMLTGNAEAVAERIAQIVKERLA
jgi:electron transfer flavoprotein beta subunit